MQLINFELFNLIFLNFSKSLFFYIFSKINISNSRAYDSSELLIILFLNS
jgi:hypothetical protein